MLQGANSTGKAIAKTKLANLKSKKCQSLFSQHYDVVSTGHHVEARLVLCPAPLLVAGLQDSNTGIRKSGMNF